MNPRRPLIWIALLYIAQGLPYGVYAEILPVYLRTQGVDLRQIGAISLIGLAWTLKFLWSPLVDRFFSPHAWMGTMLAGFAGLAWGLGQMPTTNSAELTALLILIALMALASATNDIAIDGYSIRFLAGKNIGSANGVRVAAYRVGLLICGGLLALNRYWAWQTVFVVVECLCALLALACYFAPQIAPSYSNDNRSWQSFGDDLRRLIREHRTHAFMAGSALTLLVLWLSDRALAKQDFVIKLHEVIAQWLPVDYFWLTLWLIFFAVVTLTQFLKKPANLDKPRPSNDSLGGLIAIAERPAMKAVFLFILLFKLADASMGFMIKPFWVDQGFTAEQIGLVSVNIGIGLSIAGSLLGGWYTDKVGIYKSLWVMGLWQIASNGLYAFVAWQLPQIAPSEGVARQAWMFSASAFESFTGGLGTASFLSLLMALVHPKFAASEYALLSAIFAASRSIAGFLSGFGVHHWGYAPYFALTMFLGLPAYLLLPWVKKALKTQHLS